MADTKKGREKQARDAEERQRERELEEARERADEVEPPRDDQSGEAATREDGAARSPPSTCHRRGCEEPPAFVVLERYQEETGHGAVEADAFLCREHTAEESPTNLDHAYDDYVFRVTPVPEASTADGA